MPTKISCGRMVSDGAIVRPYEARREIAPPWRAFLWGDMTEPLQLFDQLPAHIEAALRESISRFGVLVPVVRDQNGRTIDGHHRARLADELGMSYRVDVVKVADDDEAREIARTLNSDRRHMTADQRQDVAASLRAAGHSLRAISGALGVSQTQIQRDLATVTDVTVPDRTIGLDGKSRPATRPMIVATRNVREAERAALALGDVDVRQGEVVMADDLFREARKVAQQGNLDASSVRLSLPQGKYGVILADPPWRYDFAPTTSRAVENQYGTMDVVDIASYRDHTGRHVSDIAAEDCVLFMWATAPKLAEAFTVLDGWGFEYVTHMVWVKDRIGMGYWARSQHELLLIARRGMVRPPDEQFRRSSVFDGRRGDHSEKPSLHEWIMKAFSGPYVELFSRRPVDGWVGFGNQS